MLEPAELYLPAAHRTGVPDVAPAAQYFPTVAVQDPAQVAVDAPDTLYLPAAQITGVADVAPAAQ